MPSCHVIPIIKTRNGKPEFAPSILWKDLLKISNDREWVKKVYQGTHSEYFTAWFGDWIENDEKASLVVDEFGEPKIVDMYFERTGEVVPVFLNIRDEAVYQEFIENGGTAIGDNISADSYMVVNDPDGGQVDIRLQRKVHSDPRIQEAIDKYKLMVTNSNNPYVWDMEDQLGLINKESPWTTDMFKTKHRRKQVFTQRKAERLAKEARELGFKAGISPTMNLKTGRSNMYIVNVSKDISQQTSAQDRLSARIKNMRDRNEELGKRFDVLYANQGNLTALENLHAKVTAAFEARIGIMEKQYDFIKRQSFQDFLNEYLDSNNITSALVSAVTYSSKVTNQLFDRYADMQKNNEPLTAAVLQTWTDFLTAYDTLDELQTLLLEDPSIIQSEEIRTALDESIKKKNFLKDLYRTKGVTLMSKWLSPYFNGIRKKFEEDMRAEYRVEANKRKKNREYNEDVLKETQSEYVERKMKENAAKLDMKTEQLLLKELATADRDISILSRWIDNMLDTTDPVAAAVVNAFTQADERSRLDALKKRNVIYKEVIKLEQARNKGSFTSEIKFYEWFLEFDDQSVATQYLVKPWKSSLIQAESNERTKLFKHGESETQDFLDNLQHRLDVGEIDKEGYSKARRSRAHESFNSWQDHHMNIDRERLENDQMAYMQELIGKVDVQTGDIILTQDQYQDLENNYKYIGMGMHSLVKEGKVTDLAANYFSDWKANNLWKYTDVLEEWKNPQWSKFMRKVGIDPKLSYFDQDQALRNSEHHLAQFYIFITDLAEEADSKVPYSYRLGGRLPGVAKIESERMKEGQNPLQITKRMIQAESLIRPEDTERGDQILTDEKGNPKMFLPIHYVNQIELDNQSFDLPGIYFKFWESAHDYNIKRQILPELEMAKYFVSTRNAIKRNSLDKIVMSKLQVRGKGNIDELDDERSVPSTAENTQVANQLTDWFEMAVYGKKSKPGSLWYINDELVLDTAKMVDAVNRYTSLSMLAMNMVQGGANVIIGETMQAIDAFAGEHVNIKSLTKATGKYHKWLPGMMGDVGARVPGHVGTLLIEWGGVLHDDVADISFSKKTKVGQKLDLSTAFWVQQAGEHWMQSRFLYAMLIEKKAYNKEGEHIGNMLDQYYAEDGELKIKDEVSLEKSKWTQTDQEVFRRKTKGLLSRMHGEYSDLGRVAIQRYAVGKMAYMFRKFVVPGFKRRWAKQRYVERLGQTTEGNYVTTMRFVSNLFKELKILNVAMMSDEWASLSEHEQANVRRMLGEVVAVISATILANFAFRKSIEEDDEDDYFWAYMAYQAYRLETELLFFSPKLDEAMTIMRSPAASMAVAENTIKLIGQIWTPTERYERGPWKGEYKIKKTLINFVPLWKQYYKARDVEEQIVWFK